MADKDSSLLDDVFVQILQRLPMSSQRRLRLVCRRWRDVVDEHAPEQREARARILAFFSRRGASRAIVIDGNGRRARDWTCRSSRGVVGVVHMVGTCNGLLCLHETAPFGDFRVSVVTVANPITGKERVMPPLPRTATPAPGSPTSLGLYCFRYHPTTGRYKVVHVPPPCATERPEFDAVQVLTLGDSDTAWRELPVRLATGATTTCNRSAGVVSVDGTTYWLTARADRVMALDLEDDSVACFDAPPPVRPVKVPAQAACQLTNVQARLGVAVTRHEPVAAAARVEVWVLEGGRREQPRWSQRYSVVEPGGTGQGRWITAPHFTHGEYVLSGSSCRRWLYRRKVGDLVDDGDKNDAQLGPFEGAELIIIYGGLTTYPYVETREPLPSIHG